MHLCSRRLLPRRVHAHGEAKMLTQPGFSYPYRAARMLAVGGCCGCKQGSPGDGGWGGRTTPQCTGSYPAAGSLGPIAALPCHARKGNWRGARVDENWGEVVSRGGTRDPARAPLTPKLEGTCSVWDQRRAGPAQTRASLAPRTPPSLLTGSPNPQGAGGPGSCTRRGGAGAHSVAPGSIALPLALQLSAGVRSGRDHPGTRG